MGSAPSSVRLAPFADPSWDIWACSPGAYPHISPTRAQAYFELHRWEPPWGYTGEKPWFTKDYIAYLANLKCPVYMIEPVPEIPASVAYPKDAVLDYVYGTVVGPDGVARPQRFSPNDFASTLSWMLAMAISARPDEIGLWGVDMAAGEEYGPQKDGCLSLINVARSVGIKVTTPPESDLLRPTPFYGFCEVDPMHIKLTERHKELMGRISALVGEIQAKSIEVEQLRGAISNNEYIMKTWVADRKAIERSYANPDPVLEAISEPLPKPNGAHVQIEQDHGVQAQA